MSKKKVEKEIKVPRMMESLGWLTETTLQPRKGKPIEGIPTGTIVELKAQYYKTQEKTKNEKEIGNFTGRKRRNQDKDNIGGSLGITTNKGVYERAKRDKLELKGMSENGKLDKCYTALEEKSKLYDKLMDGDGNSEDDEKYEVDFFEKRFERLSKTTTGNNKINDLMNTKDDEMDEEEEVELREKAERALKRKMVMEEVERTKEGQEKAKLAKKKKEEKEKKEKELLKELYLKKQLAKMKMKRKDKVVH